MSDARPVWPPRITVERVHELHAAALAHAGGLSGVRDTGLVEAAVGGALTAAQYHDKDEDPVDPMVLAAYLLCYLSRYHAFIDGNKRVAWLAFEDQLRLLRLCVVASTDDAESLVFDVVAKKLDVDDVIEWTAARLVPYEATGA